MPKLQQLHPQTLQTPGCLILLVGWESWNHIKPAGHEGSSWESKSKEGSKEYLEEILSHFQPNLKFHWVYCIPSWLSLVHDVMVAMWCAISNPNNSCNNFHIEFANPNHPKHRCLLTIRANLILCSRKSWAKLASPRRGAPQVTHSQRKPRQLLRS